MNNESPSKQQLFAERLATIEANSEFQKSTLAEITKTLNKVVETQASLAAQQTTIESLINDGKSIRKIIADQETEIRMCKMTHATLTDEVTKTVKEIEELKGKVYKNETFTKQATWIIMFVCTPLMLYVAQQLISTFFP